MELALIVLTSSARISVSVPPVPSETHCTLVNHREYQIVKAPAVPSQKRVLVVSSVIVVHVRRKTPAEMILSVHQRIHVST